MDRLHELLAELNRGRLRGTRPAAGESRAERLLGGARRLAVYGTLAPGQRNAHALAGLDGVWCDGFVRGVLHSRGWGADGSCPGMRHDPHGPRVAVRLFESAGLAAHWTVLDAFEGRAYTRILVPVELAGGGLRVANLYAVRYKGEVAP